MGLCCRDRWPKSAKIFATSWSSSLPPPTDPKSLAAERCTSTGPHLAEIRSIAVRPSTQGLGAGRLLVDALFEEADLHRVICVCLFTRIPKFFEHLGFKIAERAKLPDKIYKDCMSCPRLLACDEIAMYRGELPQFAILDPAHADLIKLTL